MEEFFKDSSSLDLVNVEELLLRKYDINYILNLEFEEGYEIISKALEKEVEEKLWDRWLIDYRNMTKDSFISFEDYKNKLLGVSIKAQDDTSKEELLQMAKDIEDKISQQKRGED